MALPNKFEFSVKVQQEIRVTPNTLPPKMFEVGNFWLETTILIKIESHPFYPIIFAWFQWG